MLYTPEVFSPRSSLTNRRKLDIFLGGRSTDFLMCWGSTLLMRLNINSTRAGKQLNLAFRWAGQNVGEGWGPCESAGQHNHSVWKCLPVSHTSYEGCPDHTELCIWLLHLPPVFTLVSRCAYSTLKTEATCSTKTSADLQWTTLLYIPQDSTLHNHHCENIKS